MERGLAPDLKQAQALVMAGEVLVNGHKADKSDRPVGTAEAITIKARSPYVSRGALKIARAVAELAIAVPGLKVLDIGISTGGFSDFFLQHGAAEVFGVDVTIDQVDPRLRADPRLRLLETNARFLKREDVPFVPDLVVMDLSFISITAVLPVLTAFPGCPGAGPGQAAVRGPAWPRGPRRSGPRPSGAAGHPAAPEAPRRGTGFRRQRLVRGGRQGARGNQEYFFLLQCGKNNSIDDRMIADAEEI